MKNCSGRESSQVDSSENKKQRALFSSAARRNFVRRADLLWLPALFLAAFLFWFIQLRPASDKELNARIRLYDRQIAVIPLSKNQARLFRFPELPNVVFERNAAGAVRFFASDCPRQICTRAGFISLPGQFVACLPKGIILRIDDGPPPDSLMESDEEESERKKERRPPPSAEMTREDSKKKQSESVPPAPPEDSPPVSPPTTSPVSDKELDFLIG